MIKKKYSDKEIVKDILAGELRRDKALKYLLLDSGYSELVFKVIDEGGGNRKQGGNIFEECLIVLDRRIRRNEIDSDKPFSEFFEIEAKQQWSYELMTNDDSRNKVIEWIHLDVRLKEQTYRAITTNSGKSEDAEDCYQNAMIMLDTKIKEGKYNGGAIKGYFYQLCFNLWRNELRKSKLSRMEDHMTDSYTSNEDPSKLLERKERAQMLKQLFEKIGDQCKHLMHLKYVNIKQYTMEQIAQKMGYKNAQIASNALTKCRKKLWTLLKEQKQEVLWMQSI